MEIKSIVGKIKKEKPNVKSIYYVGCGASQAELYPAKYFLEANAKDLRIALYTANEFNYATPKGLNSESIVVTCSLGGTTPETVEASKLAMEKGAAVIAITNNASSPLAKACHHLVVHDWEGSYSAKMDKMNKALLVAVEILNQYEGFDGYEAMINGCEGIYEIIDNAVSSVLPQAKAFAESYKDDDVIYVMSSGATHKVAYSFSICLLMEMQWMNSGSFHDGEFFHGPFEITDKDVPFILLMNDGRTRAMDSRALTFLERFGAKTTVIDAKDHGLGSLLTGGTAEYFSPMVISAVLRVYAEQLAIIRNHPLTKRRYMWKLEY
ncbi:MAG: SIS domain-containing protein [Coprobacillus sp.]